MQFSSNTSWNGTEDLLMASKLISTRPTISTTRTNSDELFYWLLLNILVAKNFLVDPKSFGCFFNTWRIFMAWNTLLLRNRTFNMFSDILSTSKNTSRKNITTWVVFNQKALSRIKYEEWKSGFLPNRKNVKYSLFLTKNIFF